MPLQSSPRPDRVSEVPLTNLFTWLDHRDEDSQRVRELLRSLEDKGTLDALGLGPVRDAISDTLFPGCSTIQTRARYFLFVPWIYRQLERERIPASRAAREGRNRELRLAQALVKSNGNDEGIHGARVGAGLRVLPSSIYWGGLRRFEILGFAGSSSQYLARFDRHHARAGGDGEERLARQSAWHAGLPEAPSGLLDEASLVMRPEDAGYLRERILTAARDSLLAALLLAGERVGGAPYPWQLATGASLTGELQTQIRHAHAFSLVMHGAQVLYNGSLAVELRKDGAEPEALQRAYEDARSRWLTDMEVASTELARWDRDDFWRRVLERNPRVSARARAFIEQWCDAALTDPAGAVEAASLIELVRERELQLKGGLAKLSSQRARAGVTGPVGLEPLGFRWPQVRRIIDDILEGSVEAPRA